MPLASSSIAADRLHSHPEAPPDVVRNHCYVLSPRGTRGMQGTLHMTRFARDIWQVSPESQRRVFEAPFGNAAVAICHDVEFPEMARAVVRAGADMRCVPSCTDDRQELWRVRAVGSVIVPDDLLIEALIQARRRGVRIRVLVPGPHMHAESVRIASMGSGDRCCARASRSIRTSPRCCT